MTVTILKGDEKRREQNRLRAQRHRARAAGEDVPIQKPGPSRGFKFDPKKIAKRRTPKAEQHWKWAGEQVSEKGGRKRALKKYPNIGPCEMCGASKAERHHKDGNTANNEPSNIQPLCRSCHMEVDGRRAAVSEATRLRNKGRRCR